MQAARWPSCLGPGARMSAVPFRGCGREPRLPSFPWSQEALKGTQATSPGLATSASTHCSGLGPAGTNLPDFCLSSAPRSLSGFGPQQPQGSLHSLPWPSGGGSYPLRIPAGPAPLALGEPSYPQDSSLPLFITRVLTQSIARPVRGVYCLPSGAGAPSQYSAKVTKTQKIKPSCLPARL